MNASDAEKFTVLDRAIMEGHAGVVSFLLSRGVDLEYEDRLGLEPLRLASASGHVQIIHLFLNHRGVDIDFENEDGKTALHASWEHEEPRSFQVLLERGADPTIADRHGRTPLDLARQFHLQECARLLEVRHQREEIFLPGYSCILSFALS